MRIFFLSFVLLPKKQLIFKLIEQKLFHLLYFFSWFLFLLNPLSLFIVINIPLAISGLVKCFFDEIINRTLENSKCILILILDDLVIIIFFLLVGGFLSFLRLIKHMFPLLFDLQYLFGWLKDACLNLLYLVEVPPLLHPILPCKCTRSNVVGSQ